MKKIKLFLFVAVLSCPMFAQQQDEYDKGEVFVGYSSHFYVDDPGPLLSVTSRGFDAAGVYNFHRKLGIKVDVSVSASGKDSADFVPGFNNPTNSPVRYTQQLYVSTYTAGLQLKDNSKDQRFKPFAHALVGVGRLESKVTNVFCTTVSNCSNVPPNEVSTGFAMLLGAGLDIKVHRRIDIRALQLDISHISGGNNPVYFRGGSTDFRFASGIVFKF